LKVLRTAAALSNNSDKTTLNRVQILNIKKVDAIPDLMINIPCSAKVTVNYMEQNPDLTIFWLNDRDNAENPRPKP